MNVGFISTWFERGASYVTKQYINAIKDKHKVFLYARGGEYYAKDSKEWNLDYVTWGKKIDSIDGVSWRDLKRWIEKNSLDIIFFNEQRDIEIVLKIRKHFKDIKLGSYIDYYKKNTVKDFEFYDFLICNTKRHFGVFKEHRQSFYVPWGTDITLYSNNEKRESDIIRFFHSAGMSKRKGTKDLIDVFLNTDLKERSKLIIHTQLKIKEFTNIEVDVLEENNIEIIEKTVKAPGLYHLGDVYVYPTELDGLGLTIYEALSVGTPVIGTNVAPINEVIDSEFGKLIDVKENVSRDDGYYWPLSIISKKSLYENMNYYIENSNKIDEIKEKTREKAILKYNWSDRNLEILSIFENSKILDMDMEKINKKLKNLKLKKYYELALSINKILKSKTLNKFIEKMVK